MKFILIFILSFLIGWDSNEKYYIYQYSVIQFKDGSAPLIFNCKCYRSSFEKIFRKKTVEIKTDSVDVVFTMVKPNSYGRGNHTLAKNTIPYVYRELSKNGDYYLTIVPIRFNNKYRVGGEIIAISNKKICEN